MAEYIPKHKNKEWWNISPNTKTWNGGIKFPNTKTWNGGIYTETLKRGISEYTPNTPF